MVVSDADESFPENLLPEEVAVSIARKKAHKIFSEKKPDCIVLAADTIVVCDGEILGKPMDADDAFRMIKKLSGKTHQVITGVCVLEKEKEHSFFDVTKVTFHHLTDQEISFYITKYKPYDKAGAYAIQEWIGVVGIQSIEGDFYNVMGLPVSRVVSLLKTLGK